MGGSRSFPAHQQKQHLILDGFRSKSLGFISNELIEVQARIWDAWLDLTIHGLDVAHQRISHGVGPGSLKAEKISCFKFEL